MKQLFVFLVIFWMVKLPLLSSELIGYLRQYPEVVEIKALTPNNIFRESIQVSLKQLLDHKNPERGTFLQRIFISVKHTTDPVVMVTEGYAAAYGANPAYLNELCLILNANQVVVEHRYFGESCPDSLDWSFLTVENAANDHHKVVELLKPFLQGTWINTGISKGGQTALLHRVFFPADVDITVSYVAPFNFSVEDGRHEPYIKKAVGTSSQRKRVREFQKEVLRRRANLMPMFEDLIREKKFTFNASLDVIFDFCVLEYSFAFWQWGASPAQIPDRRASDEEVFEHFSKISSPDYFSKEGLERIGAFFVQAARELGYYGYDTRPFKNHLVVKNARNYLEWLFLPPGYKVGFDDTSVKKTRHFMETSDARMIFIYGANDPWTASGAEPPKKENFIKIVQQGASHNIRIAGLDPGNKEIVTGTLRNWLDIPDIKPSQN